MSAAVLTSLDLRVNSLGDEGEAAIGEALCGKEGFKLLTEQVLAFM